MQYYNIMTKDLVINALIELIERKGIRTVSFKQLDKYGNTIVSQLRKSHIDAALIFNRNLTRRFVHEYNYILKIKETDSDIQVTLKDDFSVNDLRKRFRLNLLSLDILKTFVSEEALSVLLT